MRVVVSNIKTNSKDEKLMILVTNQKRTILREAPVKK